MILNNSSHSEEAMAISLPAFLNELEAVDESMDWVNQSIHGSI